MKTFVPFFLAFFLLTSTSLTAQQQITSFENAGMAKAGDGSPCVQLAWKKGAENTAYYLVERSSDGKDFNQIALVFTSEDDRFADYTYRDKSYASAGNDIYYRITIVNERKELQCLPVKKVTLSAVTPEYSENLTGKK